MATSVGSAYVTLMPSMAGFSSKLGSEFGKSGSDSGKAFGDGLSGGVGAGVAKSSGLLGKLGGVAKTVGTVAVAGFSALTAAVTAIGGAALSAYADYEQLKGGVDTLFGDASGQLQAYAADAYRNAGLSANQYMEQATAFSASLISSLGGDTAKAAEYANTAMVDMSDNVNKMGSNMQDVQNAYQGFAKQNYTMLDNLKLGYGGTKEEMQRLIKDANALRKAQGKNADLTIDKFSDVVEAIHTVQTEMGITGTTAHEAATTISGSIGMAQASWENFLTGLGRDDADFSLLTTQLLESIGAVATNVAPRVAVIGKGIIEALPTALSGLGAVLAPVLSEALATAWNIAVGGLSNLGIQLPTVESSQITGAFQTMADAVSQAVTTVRGVIEAIGPTVSAVADTVSGAFSSFAEAAAPFATYLIGNLLPAVMSFAVGAITLFDAVKPVVLGLFSAVQDVASAFVPVIQNAFAQLTPLFGQLMSLAGQLVIAVTPMVSQIAAVVGPAVSAIGTALANFANAVLPILAGGIQIVFSVIQMLMPVLSTLLSVIGSILSVVITVASQVVSYVINAVSVVASMIGVVVSVVSGLVTMITTYVGGLPAVVGGAVSALVAAIAGGVNLIVTAVGTMYASVATFVSSLFSTVATIFNSIVSTLANAASQIFTAVTGAFSRLVSAVSGSVGSLMSTVTSIPSKIMGVFSGAGTWLIESGASLIKGFTQGIQNAVGGAVSAVGDVLSSVRSLFPFSPAKRGPFSGHGYTTWSGKALMGDFASSILSTGSQAVSAAESVLGDVSAAISSPTAGIDAAYAVAGRGTGAVAPSTGAGGTDYTGQMDAVLSLLAAILGEIPEGTDRRTQARFARKAVAYGI